MFKLYKKSSLKNWQGRVDNPHDPQSWRWHQIVEPLNLEKESTVKNGFCFLGYACDEGVRRNLGRLGAKLGPSSLRSAMGSLPVHGSGSLNLFDAGDIFCRRKKLETTQEELAKAVAAILAKGLCPIVLGGGHDVAYGHFRGLLEAQKNGVLPSHIKNIGIINFDAHFDLRPYPRGPHSGSPFLQIADDLKKQGQDFHYLVLGIQHAGNTRALFETANRLGARYRLAEEINLETLRLSKKIIQDFIDRVDAIYLTFCLDALPFSHAPGVSAPNPYGLNPHRTLALFKHIARSGKVISFDVAELSPPYDIDNHTAKFAAYLVFELVATVQRAGG